MKCYNDYKQGEKHGKANAGANRVAGTCNWYGHMENLRCTRRSSPEKRSRYRGYGTSSWSKLPRFFTNVWRGRARPGRDAAREAGKGDYSHQSMGYDKK